MIYDVLIIGGGQYGLSVAENLRKLNFAGSIAIVGDEAALPYQRPPLSKTYISSEVAFENIAIRNSNYYRDQNIDLFTGELVTQITEELQPSEPRFTIRSQSSVFTAKKIVLGLGVAAKTLPKSFGPLDNVFTLRNTADALKIREKFCVNRSIAIIGSGFIGLEASHAASLVGMQVTILTRTDQVLRKITSTEISKFLRKKTEEAGIRIVSNSKICDITSTAENAVAIDLENGDRIDVNMVLVCIGSEVRQLPVSNFNLATRGGRLVVNQDCQTSAANVWAGGDMVAVAGFGEAVNDPVESVFNALYQGEITAASIMSETTPQQQVPWFWSDQGSTKLQICGLPSPGDELISFQTDKGLVVLHFENGDFSAAECVNEPAFFMLARKALARAVPLTILDFQKNEMNLKDVLKS
ncbi:MAG: Rhodocoxin reductase [Actinomycetota bacterium]|jgi:3-phenylpropionate/trans-cinnamate dioxygenase ferredoxin reductase subunit